jgi:hypothetical protein
MLGAATAVIGVLSGRIALLRAAELGIPVPASPSAPVPPQGPLPLTEPLARPAKPAGSAAAVAPQKSVVRPPLRTAEPKTAPLRPAPAPSAATTVTAVTPCDPPYYLDSRGHLIYKSECFR